ncbi:MAG TPA: uroporphyrinogen decarboxylase family protein [Phycisphaerae bacterium]|nr:uroporphyrinogen decarboxylase family protein [Phycisphaerae bacterium]
MSVSVQSVSFLGSVSFGWLHQRGGFVFDEPYFLDPRIHLEREHKINEYVARHFPDDPIYNMEAHLVQPAGRRRRVALVGPLQPNLILGAAVGARFVFYGDRDPDITPTPLADSHDVGELTSEGWASMWPLSEFLDQIQRAREMVGSRNRVVPPYFWDSTGRATIHGILTTAQKLIGERVFVEMIENPSFIHDLFAWIADAYVAQIRLFAGAADMEITGVHVGDCSLCMVSPDQFTEFVLPHANRLAREFGPVRFHSCGKVDHLLEAFKAVDNLAILNFGSGTSVRKMRELFGRMRIDLTPDVKMLTYGSPAEIDAWVRRTIDENDGGPLEIQNHIDVAQPEGNTRQMIETLRAMGVACEREQVY